MRFLVIKKGDTYEIVIKQIWKIGKTLTGYTTFIPNPLPPEPPVKIDNDMQALLSIADRKLGRLDGIVQVLPNPNLFLSMYVKKEAVLSSQIEGTQASLIDVLDVSRNVHGKNNTNEIGTVVNYVDAMDWGLKHLQELPLSLRLIREIHKRLLQGTRGSDKNPGEFRRSQNWIGIQGCTLTDATFVPPPVEQMLLCMNNLETFFYDKKSSMPALIQIAIIHAQFETIHPFLDGNGRMGRLLITFWLCQQDILSKPLLYLSYYFKQHRTEYYDLLMHVRLDGDWESWIKFFLRGVAFVSDEAIISAKEIIQIKEKHAKSLFERKGNMGNHQKLLEILFDSPIIDRKKVMEKLKVSSPTAGDLLLDFCKKGVLIDAQPSKTRGKKYYFKEYLDILQKGTEIGDTNSIS